MDILEAIEKCTYSANIDGISTRVVDSEELVGMISDDDGRSIARINEHEMHVRNFLWTPVSQGLPPHLNDVECTVRYKDSKYPDAVLIGCKRDRLRLNSYMTVFEHQQEEYLPCGYEVIAWKDIDAPYIEPSN